VPSWYRKYRVARRHSWRPIEIPIVASLLLVGFSLWPVPSIGDLQLFSGALVEIRRPPEYPRAQLLVSTGDGEELFIMDGAKVGTPAVRSLKPGDRIEVWSRKDGRSQHVWQLVANGNMLLPFERTVRFWKGVRVGAAVAGLLGLALTTGVIEYLYRKHN
jgi:hypothetical protein